LASWSVVAKSAAEWISVSHHDRRQHPPLRLGRL